LTTKQIHIKKNLQKEEMIKSIKFYLCLLVRLTFGFHPIT